MKKQNVVYIDNEMLGIKKNEILLLATIWMDLEAIMLDEISPHLLKFYYEIAVNSVTSSDFSSNSLSLAISITSTVTSTEGLNPSKSFIRV